MKGSYADIVDDPAELGNGGPLAHWRCAGTATVADRIGNLDGTVGGTGAALVAGLPQNSDEALDLKGTANVTVADDNSLHLASVSILVWFSVNVFPADTAAYPIFCKNDTAAVSDFLLFIPTGGTRALRARFRITPTADADLDTPVDTLTLGRAHCAIVTANAAGFTLWLDGVNHGTNTSYTDGLSANAATLRFGLSPTFAVSANLVIDEIAIYDRVLTQSEILALSQREGRVPAVAVPENAVCYVTGGDATPTVVTSIAALQTAIGNANPGDEILVATNTYTAGTCTINAQGTEANPIIIRPQAGIGQVTFANVTFDWNPASSYVVFAEFYHKGGRHNLRGTNVRLDRCRFRQVGISPIHVFGARNSRISRCDFSDWLAGTNDLRAIYFEPNALVNGMNFLVDYCCFRDINPATGGASMEILGSFAQDANFDFENTVIVDHCLFRNIQTPNETELVTMKFGGWTWRFCTIEGVGERLTFRRGNNQEVRSCWFEGVAIPIECYGSNNLIIGNNLGTGTARISCGSFAYPPVGVGYATTKNTRLIGNTGGTLRIGHFNGTGPKTNTDGINYYDNTSTIDIVGGSNNNLTNNVDNEPFVAAVKLLPADVGLNADDPLRPA